MYVVYLSTARRRSLKNSNPYDTTNHSKIGNQTLGLQRPYTTITPHGLSGKTKHYHSEPYRSSYLMTQTCEFSPQKLKTTARKNTGRTICYYLTRRCAWQLRVALEFVNQDEIPDDMNNHARVRKLYEESKLMKRLQQEVCEVKHPASLPNALLTHRHLFQPFFHYEYKLM